MTNTSTPPATKSQLRLNSMKRVMNSMVLLVSDLNKHIADYESSMVQNGMKVDHDAYIHDLFNQRSALDRKCSELSIEIGLLTLKIHA